MKKLIFLFSIIATLFIQGAISQEQSPQDYTVPYTDSYFSFTSTANATTATDSIWYYTIWVKTKMPYKCDYRIKLTYVSGTKRSTPIIRQGKKFLNDTWTNIDTVQWKSGSDTVKYINATSAVNYYKYQRLYLKSALKGFIYKVDELSLNIWEQ